MYDSIVATLQCPRCGTVVRDAEIQTYLADGFGDTLRVGHRFDLADLETGNLLDAGYALVNAPGEDGAVRLLEEWQCPGCGTRQWAVVTIIAGTLHSVVAVTLDRATLESVNVISSDGADVAARRLSDEGDPGADTGANSVDILLQRLP